MKKSLFLFLIIITLNSVSGQEKPISIYYEKADDGFVFYADNIELVPYTVQINFQELKNLASDANKESFVITIPARTSNLRILKLLKKNPDKGTSFDFNFLYAIGDLALAPDEDFPYWLPYKHGKRVRVGQGNNGSGTHRGINAIDFNLDIGDSIYAARSGLVVEVKEDSDIGGNGPKYEPYGNFIKVYHEDGTLGSYVHLVKNGSLVEKGDQINQGQFIGISGNTGWSSGPHLHFMVAQNRDFKNFTLPIKFLNYEEQLFIPLESKSYYAYHPGKPKFDVQDKFQEAEFEEKLVPSSLENKIEFDSEEYGEYVLIYVDNGMATEMNGILKLQLKNLISTKKLPYKFVVPANTRMYLLALRPDDGAESFGYQLSGEFQ